MTAALQDAGDETAVPDVRVPLRIVVRQAPRREPPFEDELSPSAVLAGYDQVLPFERSTPHRVALGSGVLRGALPEPAIWGRRLLVGLIESADGRRPLAQLAPLLSLSVGRGVGMDFERAAIAGHTHWLHRAAVRTMRATEPAQGVAELSATLDIGERVRAVALRLEAYQGRWRCTRLQLG